MGGSKLYLMGDISYSVYLVHILSAKIVNGYTFFNDFEFLSISVPLAFIIWFVLNRLVESPSVKLSIYMIKFGERKI